MNMRKNVLGLGVGLALAATMVRITPAAAEPSPTSTISQLMVIENGDKNYKLFHAAPLPALQRAGVHCVLGSDDPTPMGTSFRRELEVARTLGVDLARLEADARRRWTEMTGQVL